MSGIKPDTELPYRHSNPHIDHHVSRTHCRMHCYLGDLRFHMPKPGNIIRFTTTVEGADEFASILQQALTHVEGEKGTTTWFAGRDEGDSTMFFVVDLFTDGDARSAHFGGAAAGLILGQGAALLAGPPEIFALQLLGEKNV